MTAGGTRCSPMIRRAAAACRRCAACLAEDDAGRAGYALYRTQSSWDEGIADGTIRRPRTHGLGPGRHGRTVGGSAQPGSRRRGRRPESAPSTIRCSRCSADPRRAQPLVSDALWVRLIDLPAALCQRTYASAVDVVLDVMDPFLPENAGRWRFTTAAVLTTRQGAVRAHARRRPTSWCPRTRSAPATWAAPASASSRRPGTSRELTPGALARLAAAMSWDPRPWCSMMF